MIILYVQNCKHFKHSTFQTSQNAPPAPGPNFELFENVKMLGGYLAIYLRAYNNEVSDLWYISRRYPLYSLY